MFKRISQRGDSAGFRIDCNARSRQGDSQDFQHAGGIHLTGGINLQMSHSTPVGRASHRRQGPGNRLLIPFLGPGDDGACFDIFHDPNFGQNRLQESDRHIQIDFRNRIDHDFVLSFTRVIAVEFL